MQAPGCVYDDQVQFACRARLDSIERHCARVRFWCACDHVDFEPASPNLKLIHRRGAKCICRAEEQSLTLGLKTLSQLRYCCCLARTIDTNHHNDRRFVIPLESRWRIQPGTEFRAECLRKLLGIDQTLISHNQAKRFQNFGCRLNSQICLDKQSL